MRVAPSSMASAKSPLMPIDSTSSFKPRMRRRPALPPLPQTAKAGPRHILRHAPGRNRHQPARFQMLQIRQPFQQLAPLRPTPAPTPPCVSSGLSFTSISTGSRLPNLPAASFSRSASRSESSESIAVKQLRRPRRLVRSANARSDARGDLPSHRSDRKGCRMQCLGRKLLHAILAKQPQPQRRSLGNRLLPERSSTRPSAQLRRARAPPPGKPPQSPLRAVRDFLRAPSSLTSRSIARRTVVLAS